MKITDFGHSEHRILSAAIEKALKAVGEEYGVSLTAHGGQIGSGGGVVKLKVEVLDTGAGMKGAEQQFRLYARMIGLMPDDFGKEFYFRHEVFVIDGINPNSPKYAVSAHRKRDKKGFRFPVASVKAGMPFAAAA